MRVDRSCPSGILPRGAPQAGGGVQETGRDGPRRNPRGGLRGSTPPSRLPHSHPSSSRGEQPAS